MLGVETALAVVLTTLVEPGVLTLAQALGALSWQPARVVGPRRRRPRRPDRGRPPREPLRDRPRAHAGSSTAPASRASSRNSPWDGWKLTGKVRHTVYRGTPPSATASPPDDQLANS